MILSIVNAIVIEISQSVVLSFWIEIPFKIVKNIETNEKTNERI
jgi:hypothetical protein